MSEEARRAEVGFDVDDTPIELDLGETETIELPIETSEEDKFIIDKYVSQAPKFKPVKALSATGKMEYTAASAVLSGLADDMELIGDDYVLAAEMMAAIVASLERALRTMAVSATAYEVWSRSLPADQALQIIMEVFSKQEELLGK